MLEAFTQWLMTLDPLLVHGVLFTLLFVQGIGVPGIPFELVWLTEGILIRQGRVALLEAIFWGAAGNWLGNLVGYMLGERAARLLPARLRRSVGVNEVRAWFSRWGVWMIVFSRWLGFVRTPFILYAGAAGMSLRTYALASAVGSLLWVTVWQVGLWIFGEVFLRLWAEHQWHLTGGIVLAALLLLGKGLFLRWSAVLMQRIRRP